ncbi:MAG TPA: hypothetical protein VGG04_19785 [Candidatus Sulfotelmatobacter sp.]|jgi:hypothetical protein
MTTDTNTSVSTSDVAPAPEKVSAKGSSLLKLPGLIAISLYMLLLAGTTVVSVVEQRTGVVYLIFSVFFIAGAFGLLLLLRWGWALTLAAVAILSGWFLWDFSVRHSYPSLMHGLLNLLFFLYLVRTDVREKLK